jgi:cellulose biosynthesis protein BcsQ
LRNVPQVSNLDASQHATASIFAQAGASVDAAGGISTRELQSYGISANQEFSTERKFPGGPTVELSGLYELLERFNRTNQLPAFLVGVVTTILVGLLASRVLRLRIGPAARLYDTIDRLHEEIKTLGMEKDRIQTALHHAEKSAEAARSLSNELKGRVENSDRTIAALKGDCERWKDKAVDIAAKAQALWQRYAKMWRLNENMQVQLDVVAKGNGRIWEVPAARSANPFRPLSQRHAPIVSLLNLKGGVGKTTIAANMAIATAHLGWRALLVDLDHQGSLSQLVLSNSAMQELLGSRRLIHQAMGDPDNGLARFREAVVRSDIVAEGAVSLVGADEELLDIETTLAHRWPLFMTPDDVRFRLRSILHAREISELFDFIILDCPPRLTTACINALAASDYVLIPVLPNKASTEAVPRLLRWINRLREVICPELSILGIIGNKAKYYGDAPVKKQQAELKSLDALCRDAWGDVIRFFSPLPMHDPLVQPLPALEPKSRGAYLDLVRNLNQELPHYARSRSAKLSSSADPSVRSIGG